MYVVDVKEKTIEFIYTQDGFLERQKVVVAGSGDIIEFIYYYTQGNLVKIQEQDDNELKATVLFEYDNDSHNSMDVDFFDFKQIGFVNDTHFGKQSKKLVKTAKVFDANSELFVQVDHFYEIDADGNTKSMEMRSGNSKLKKYNFIFQ
jgi:hypothetical protein